MWRRRNRGSGRRVPWGGSAVLCLSSSESVQAARVAAALLAHSVTRPRRSSFRLPCRLEASCCCDCHRIGELSRLPGDPQCSETVQALCFADFGMGMPQLEEDKEMHAREGRGQVFHSLRSTRIANRGNLEFAQCRPIV